MCAFIVAMCKHVCSVVMVVVCVVMVMVAVCVPHEDYSVQGPMSTV